MAVPIYIPINSVGGFPEDKNIFKEFQVYSIALADLLQNTICIYLFIIIIFYYSLSCIIKKKVCEMFSSQT